MRSKHSFFAWCKGVVVLRNHANAPVKAYIDGGVHVIGPNESITVKLKEKLEFISIKTEQSELLCRMYARRGLICTITQSDLDIVMRMSSDAYAAT